MILDAVRESGGVAVAVPESQIAETMQAAVSAEGISFCPEAAACVLAARMLVEQGVIGRAERVTLFNTGAATKYVETVPLKLPTISRPTEVDYSTLA